MLSTCLDHRFDPNVRLFVPHKVRTKNHTPFRAPESSFEANDSAETSENNIVSRQ